MNGRLAPWVGKEIFLDITVYSILVCPIGVENRVDFARFRQ